MTTVYMQNTCRPKTIH